MIVPPSSGRFILFVRLLLFVGLWSSTLQAMCFYEIARRITEETMGGSENALQVNGVYRYQSRLARVTSGQFYGSSGAISNFWRWSPIKPDGKMSTVVFSGYGSTSVLQPTSDLQKYDLSRRTLGGMATEIVPGFSYAPASEPNSTYVAKTVEKVTANPRSNLMQVRFSILNETGDWVQDWVTAYPPPAAFHEVLGISVNFGPSQPLAVGSVVEMNGEQFFVSGRSRLPNYRHDFWADDPITQERKNRHQVPWWKLLPIDSATGTPSGRSRNYDLEKILATAKVLPRKNVSVVFSAPADFYPPVQTEFDVHIGSVVSDDSGEYFVVDYLGPFETDTPKYGQAVPEYETPPAPNLVIWGREVKDGGRLADEITEIEVRYREKKLKQRRGRATISVQ